jgi:hypothetical protein
VNELQMIMVYVAGLASGEAGKWLMTPSVAAREVWQETLKERFRRVEEAAEVKKHGKPLTINHRVAFKAITEASMTDDEVTADYLGGVLAASGPNDDSGAAIVAQIGRLSSHQLRFHYVIYRELRRLWPLGARLNLHQETEAKRAGLRLDLRDLANSLGMPGLSSISSNITVLARERLITDEWRVHVVNDQPVAEVRPSGIGAEFFLWGHGAAPIAAGRLLDPATELEFLTKLPATPKSALMNPPQLETAETPSR